MFCLPKTAWPPTLIVLALTGGPVANAMCVAWCGPERTPMGTGCHHSMPAPMSPSISDGSGTCAELVADNPFLREEGDTRFHGLSSPGILHTPNAPLRGVAWLRQTLRDMAVLDGQLQPARVLRL